MRYWIYGIGEILEDMEYMKWWDIEGKLWNIWSFEILKEYLWDIEKYCMKYWRNICEMLKEYLWDVEGIFVKYWEILREILKGILWDIYWIIMCEILKGILWDIEDILGDIDGILWDIVGIWDIWRWEILNGYWVLHVGEKDTLQGYLNEIEMKRELSKHNIERKYI